MDLLKRILDRDVRAGARLLRWIDDGSTKARDLLKLLYAHTGHACIVGITGSPGAGKSTLTDCLIQKYRSQNKTVAVVAVDPSSPFSGGAILGDRIRMQDHATDDGVFIRSFATRGHLGGLTGSTADVVLALDAMGWDVILIETVGVGQDEVEVQRLSHTTVVVVNPGLGDEIQAIKAGIFEIADIFVINKADREGADRTFKELQMMLDLGLSISAPTSEPLNLQNQPRMAIPSWTPKILKTIASAREGIDELMEVLLEHRRLYEKACQHPEFVKFRLRENFLDIFRRTLFASGMSYLLQEHRLSKWIDQLKEHQIDPYSLADQVLKNMYDRS